MIAHFREIALRNCHDNLKKCGCLPCNFSSSLGLLSNLRQFSITALLIEDARSFWWLKSMKGPLSKSPLSFPLLFTIVFLGGEGSLSPTI